MKKKRVRKKVIRLLSVICLILVGVVIILFLFVNRDKKSFQNKIVGEWTTDGVTVYKFNDNSTGVLILPLGKYKFDYTIDDTSLFIDFENKKSIDSKYTYKFNKGKLILKGSNGEFVFKKK